MCESDQRQAGALSKDELVAWVRGELWAWEDSGESYDSLARRIGAVFLDGKVH